MRAYFSACWKHGETGVPHIDQVVEQMRQGGYLDRIMAGGPELARVQAFLRACAGEGPLQAPADPLQQPKYPCFPGLRHRPWHDPRAYQAVRLLESAYADIRAEALNLGEGATLDYSAAVRPQQAWLEPGVSPNPSSRPGTWTVYLFNHMGVDVESVRRACPRTAAVLRSLPRHCAVYPWGDMLFSAMSAHSRLQPHCSIDNLRVRLHLGITVPERCGIRVGSETRHWDEGQCLVFEDSFEHEVWNHSDARRIVLIADLWHPDLTDVEIEALTAGFCKSEVRRIFLRERIGITDSPQAYLPFIEEALQRQDQSPLIRRYWSD